MKPSEGTPEQPLSVLETHETPDSEALFAAAMAAVQAPTAEEQVPVPVVAEAVATPPVVAPPPPEVKQETEPTVPTPAVDRIAPTLLKLMERESAVVERESKLKAAEADILALRQHIDSYEAAQKKFKYNPVDYIRSLAPDVNLADLAKQLWYEQLGEAAPADYRATQEARKARSTVEDLRAEMEQKIQAERQRWQEEQAQQQQEMAYNQYLGALGAIAKEVPPEYPLVKSFASSSPDRVQQALFKIAQQHAQATGGQVLSPAECAAKLNSELEGIRNALVPPAPAAQPAPPKAAPPVATLRNKHTSIQPNRTAAQADDDEAKFAAAMEAVQALSR